MDIDYEKLSKYINLRLTLRDRVNGTETFHKLPFRKCTVDDFLKKGLIIPDEQRGAYNLRLCPDTHTLHSQIYKILNGYSNRMKRVSFSVDIYKCEEKKFIGNKCKDDKEIKKLLQ